MAGLLARTAEVGWVVTDPYWGDVVSDLSSFHRIDDPEGLPADRLWALVERLPAYDGVLAARLREEDEDHSPQSTSNAGGQGGVRHYNDISDNPDAAALFD